MNDGVCHFAQLKISLNGSFFHKIQTNNALYILPPWLSWLKRLSSKQEIGSSNLPGGFINLTPFELMIYIIDKYLILLKRKKLADQDVGSR